MFGLHRFDCVYIILVCLRILVSYTYCVVFFVVFHRLVYPMLPVSLCFSSSCVPYVASFSVFFVALCTLCRQFLQIVHCDCPSVVSNVYLYARERYIVFRRYLFHIDLRQSGRPFHNRTPYYIPTAEKYRTHPQCTGSNWQDQRHTHLNKKTLIKRI